MKYDSGSQQSDETGGRRGAGEEGRACLELLALPMRVEVGGLARELLALASRGEEEEMAPGEMDDGLDVCGVVDEGKLVFVLSDNVSDMSVFRRRSGASVVDDLDAGAGRGAGGGV